MKGPESYILRCITEYLGVKGYLFKRNNSGMMFIKGTGRDYAVKLGEKGWPDIIGVMKDGTGRFFGIECKAPGKKPTDDQLKVLAKIQANKGVAIVAYDLDDVISAGL